MKKTRRNAVMTVPAATEPKWVDPFGIILGIFGIIGTFAFAYVERHIDTGLLRISVFLILFIIIHKWFRRYLRDKRIRELAEIERQKKVCEAEERLLQQQKMKELLRQAAEQEQAQYAAEVASKKAEAGITLGIRAEEKARRK